MSRPSILWRVFVVILALNLVFLGALFVLAIVEPARFPQQFGFAADPLPSNLAITPVVIYQQEKTLWDWLQLLLVPVVLAVGGFLLTRYENRAAAQLQYWREQEARNLQQRQEEEARRLQEQREKEARALQGLLRASERFTTLRSLMSYGQAAHQHTPRVAA